MHTRHPMRAALIAALVPLVVILAFGNTWFVRHVAFGSNHSNLVQRGLFLLDPIRWTFTPEKGSGAGTVWFAQILTILLVVGGEFLVVFVVARRAVGASLWVGAWGATVLVAMFGEMVVTYVTYGVFLGDANVDRYGRFWHAVFQGQEAALWGAWMGLIAGGLAAALVGGVHHAPSYAMSGPLPGSPAWSQYGTQQTFVEQPTYAAPPPGMAPPPADPPSTPQPIRRAPGDPTVVMVQPTEWSSPTPPPPPTGG